MEFRAGSAKEPHLRGNIILYVSYCCKPSSNSYLPVTTDEVSKLQESSSTFKAGGTRAGRQCDVGFVLPKLAKYGCEEVK